MMNPLTDFPDTLPSELRPFSPMPRPALEDAFLGLRSRADTPPLAGVIEAEAWFVCHTRPRREKQFAMLMAAERFEHFLPLVTSVHHYEGSTKRFTKPLFPGYVFARLELERKARIYQRELLARAIPVADEASFLRQLEDVRTVIAAGYELSTVPMLTKGQRVKVMSGPLYGIEGFVDDSANPRGIVVAVDILRQGVLVRIPIEQLKLLE